MADKEQAAPPDLTLTEQELFQRLGWFTQVRWGAGVCATAFMAIGWYLFGVRFSWAPASAVVAGLFAYNFVFWVWARQLYRRRGIRKLWITTLAHAQITCDLVATAALVHTIGGVENHFVLVFLFPIMVACAFFPMRTAFLYATLAAVLINLIGWGEWTFYATAHHALAVTPIHGAPSPAPLVAPEAASHWVFVLQVCVAMTFAVYTTVLITGSIAARLRGREEELARAHRDLKSLEQVKSQFMRKTSHELRAPVGAMQSLLKAAIGQMAPEAPGRALVDRCIRRSESTMDLIDDLLRYSRLQANAIQPRFEPVDLAEVVHIAADLFRAQAEEKGVQLEVRTEPAVLPGDRDGLTDLADNLISNAIRYTLAGGRVTVEVNARDGAPRLTVSDTGIGIPADELPRIFEEFFRGEKAKQAVQHGTGLGMTIAKRVADMHGGRIEVASEVGRGTTFRVYFPHLNRRA